LPSLELRTDLAGPVMTIIGDAVAGANFRLSEPLAAQPVTAAANTRARAENTEGARS
jgi:uroporphyrin-III C-methyltransferase/precorrin-2 dehydrogenase/sirohydrochlorin ferrochelatase